MWQMRKVSENVHIRYSSLKKCKYTENCQVSLLIRLSKLAVQ